MSDTALALTMEPVPGPRPAWAANLVDDWKPVKPLGGAEWAELERVLSVEESPSSPGRWKSVPWQRELLDAFADERLNWIPVLKAAQMGVSELVRCAIGRWARLDPGDVLWVMTTEDAAKKAMKKLRAMFRSTPSLRRLFSERRSKSTLLEMVLTNGMRIVIGWAGSAQSLASDPFPRVILDEVAKYRASTGGEASAVDLAKERTKVFGRRGKIILLSSPKHDSDLISTAYNDVRDRRAFNVPCPSCGELQSIDWSFVRWPGGDPTHAPSDREERLRLADEIEASQSAWVACRVCVDGRLEPRELQEDARARWVSEDEEAAEDARRRAYHVPEFFHWATTLSDLVAKYLRCTNPIAVQGFYNGSLGIAYKAELTSIEPVLFASRAIHAPRIVPLWATTVISTADTQQGGWWFMVRAWGPGARSRLLDWGFASTSEDLLSRSVNAKFEVEGTEAKGELASVHMFAVDTGGGMLTPDGSRTKEVYELVRRTRRAHALKGESGRGALEGSPWRTTKVALGKPGGTQVPLELYLVNKNYYADELARLVRATDPVLWEECLGAENQKYTRQMASEQKVLITSSSGNEWRWEKKSKNSENHLWDTARYQIWAADFCRVEDRRAPTWNAVSGGSFGVIGSTLGDQKDDRRWPIGRGSDDAKGGGQWKIGR